MATWKLGNIYLIKHDTEQALPYLLKAILQKPDLGQAHRDSGRAYANQGQFEKAIEQFKIVTQLSPEEHVSHYRMALIYKQLGNKEEEKKKWPFFRN